jgi:hypothetical protein
MKLGDLVRFTYQYSIVDLQVVSGVLLDVRDTKWSDEYRFYKVLTNEGVVIEVPVKNSAPLEVLSCA